MTITITLFQDSPDRGRGLARDMPVRWALEETGHAYDMRPLPFTALKEADHLAHQPFGQIPVYEDKGLVLFESGAIVHHIAHRHSGLLPQDAHARARAVMWMFAALSTVEPPIVEFGMAMLLESDKSWSADRQSMLEQRVRTRLGQLAKRLGSADWLDGEFSAGDLMMVAVLRRLQSSGILHDHPTLSAYIARGEARPAFQRAFADQRALFLESQQQG